MKKVFPDAGLYGILDHGLSLGRGNVAVAKAMLEAGITIIQYREKERKMGVMLEECKAIRAMTAEAGAIFIVNDFVSLALLVDADGVHVGQEDLPVGEVRRLLGPDRLIGLSTHSPEQAQAAVRCGADYIGVGPLFATKTKKDVVAPVGLDYLDYVVANIHLPFVAIGGINAATIGLVAGRGARCCCCVSAIVSAEDIAGAVKALRHTMEQAGTL